MMDLLAPCRSCLQCLPFFRVSSPPPIAPSSSSSSSIAETKEKSFSQTATAGQQQHLDLPLSESTAEVEPPQAPMEPAKGMAPIEKRQEEKVDPLAEQPAMSEIIIAPPVTSNNAVVLPQFPGTSKTTVSYELPLQVPFINDVTFSTGGLMPLPSPMTPAPIGSGRTEGPYAEHGHPHRGHGHPHGGHRHPHHGHGHPHHGHGHHL